MYCGVSCWICGNFGFTQQVFLYALLRLVYLNTGNTPVSVAQVSMSENWEKFCANSAQVCTLTPT